MMGLRVGIVSETFPPFRHVSGTRAHGFAVELARLGAEVTVFTGGPPGSDSTVVVDPELTTVRVPSPAAIEPSSQLVPSAVERSLTRALARMRTVGRLATEGPYSGWVRDLARFVRHVGVPPCDVVWGTFGTASAHAAARRLAAGFGGPWVADFKDDWRPYGGLAGRVLWVRYLARLRSAAALTAASRLEADRLAAQTRRSVLDIYTGVDPTIGAPAADLGPGFNIVFSGHVSDERMDFDTAMGGIRAAIEELGPGVVRVHYFGHRPGPLIDGLGGVAAETLVDHGFADQRKVVAAQRGADLLLHTPCIRRPTLCVKFPEYLASGRPVLMVPAEDDRRLASFCAGPEMFAASSVEAVRRIVVEAVDRRIQQGRSLDVVRDLDWFSRSSQAARLLEELERVANT